MSAELRARFFRKVDVRRPEECWPWIGAFGSHGYGQMDIDGRMHNASRVAWMVAYGDPGDLHVLHRCDNPPCVNPDHLFLGTHADNMRDSAAKGRNGAQTHRAEYRERVRAINPRGEQHGSAKLTDDDVRTIRKRFAEGASKRGLGREFGVDDKAIRALLSGRTWRHV